MWRVVILVVVALGTVGAGGRQCAGEGSEAFDVSDALSGEWVCATF